MKESTQKSDPGEANLSRESSVVVVGAAGGVGRSAVGALLERGYKVVAIDRRTPEGELELAGLAEDPNVSWHRAQIEKDPLEPLLAGSFAVVNAAGDVGLSETYSEVVASNVVGVDKLYSAAKKVGVSHFIHISAGTFYEPSRHLRTEEDPVEPNSDFARSKLDSERIFQRSKQNGTHWTILRPSYVYGPGCTSMAATLVTLPPILGDFLKYQPGFRSGARTTWCHVEDLAQAILTVLGNEDAYEEIFNVADNTPQSAGESITSITEAYGLQLGVIVPLPTKLLLRLTQKLLDSTAFERGTKTALSQLWRRVRRKHKLQTPLRPQVNSQAATQLARDLLLDNRKLVRLGWSPRWVSFSHGIPSTIQWYQSAGWVPIYDATHIEQMKLNAKPSLFSFEQTLTGKLKVYDQYQQKLPLRSTIESKTELLERIELTEENDDPDSPDYKVVIQFEVTLRSLLNAEGDIDGLVWIAGITSLATPHCGTYTFNWRENTFFIDLGFKDSDGQNYRATLHGKRGGLLSTISKQTFPRHFHGNLYDEYGNTVGDLTLNLLLAETMLSILFGLR